MFINKEKKANTYNQLYLYFILINLMLKMVKRDKEGHYIIANVSINEKYVTM